MQRKEPVFEAVLDDPLVACILIRKKYGGMAGDMGLLAGCGARWASADRSMLPVTTDSAVKQADSYVSECPQLTSEGVCEFGLDFHCTCKSEQQPSET